MEKAKFPMANDDHSTIQPDSDRRPSATKGKLLIVDPVCVQEIGHNLSAIQHFYRYFKDSGGFRELLCLTADTLNIRDGEAFAIKPSLPFLYGNVMNLPDKTADGISTHRDAINLSVRGFEDAITRHSLSSEDCIFAPSADLYTILGLMGALGKLDSELAPKVVLRLINVLDWTDILGIQHDPREILGELKQHTESGYKFILSAETPIYAEWLANQVESFVPILPYPLTESFSTASAAEDDPIVISSLGSARYDKGYLRLYDIIHDTIQATPGQSLEFRIQPLTGEPSFYQAAYTAKLGALPGVHILPERLSRQDLISEVQRAAILLAPYDPEVYAMRGSAMLMEAIAVGRFFVCTDHCGFSDQVKYYRCGAVAVNNKDFTERLVHLVTSRGFPDTASWQARQRLEIDSRNAYMEVFSQ